MIIRTPDDWWALATVRIREGKFNELLYTIGVSPSTTCKRLIQREQGLSRSRNLQKALTPYIKGDFQSALDAMLAKKDGNLWYVFQSIWEDAPDHPKIHGYPMWADLCDLCSEGMGMKL